MWNQLQREIQNRIMDWEDLTGLFRRTDSILDQFVSKCLGNSFTFAVYLKFFIYLFNV